MRQSARMLGALLERAAKILSIGLITERDE
jgi:hypothetical protein